MEKDKRTVACIIAGVIVLAIIIAAFYFLAKPKVTTAPTNEGSSAQNYSNMQISTDQGNVSSSGSAAASAGNNSNNQTKMDQVKIDILKQGAGAESKNGDALTVDYVGTLEDGTKFDSSIDRGTPFSFTLGVGQVIVGWDEGMVGMKVGEERKLTIPASLGYGAGGVPGVIPGNATLIFDVTLLKIN
jgi:peptidylprolyl isomerase